MNIKQKRLRIFAERTSLRNNYLTENFKSDIANLAPAAIVEKYGTHVLTNITLGAKFQVGYRTQTTNSNRKEAVKAGISFSALFKIFGMNVDINYSQSEATTNFDQTVFYRTIGGDGSKGLIGELNLDNSPPKLSIANWQSTCTPTNAALIDIDQNGLIPLEELITDASKKAAVKAYINQYLIDNQINMTYEKIPIYRYYNPTVNDHLYSPGSPTTYSPPGFISEGVEFYAFDQQAPNTTPVYSYVTVSGSMDHYLALDKYNVPGYKYEGIVFYVYREKVANSIPIYGFYSGYLRNHFLTKDSAGENAQGYQHEGIYFYTPI